jgi:hypothetical protein
VRADDEERGEGHGQLEQEEDCEDEDDEFDTQEEDEEAEENSQDGDEEGDQMGLEEENDLECYLRNVSIENGRIRARTAPLRPME